MTTSQNGGVEHRPVRSFASHTPKWQRFQNKIVKSSDANDNKPSVKSSEKEIVPYQRQYSHVYSYRLAALKDGCWKRLNQPPTTKGCRNVNRILELQEDTLSNVVGTIILESMNGNSDDNYYNEDDDDGEDLQHHPDANCRSGDQLFLEDESGRVALRFVDDVDADDNGKYKRSSTTFAYQYCTGVVVGVHGSVDAKGMMHARRIVTPALAPPIVAPNTAGTDDDNNDDDGESTSAPHLLLVSSLLCGDPEVSSLPREMLVSYLQGHFHDGASKVARVIVAGSGPGAMDPAMGLREFDLWGLEVTRTAGIPLDILPSATDPTTRNWPQRPLHSSLLPHTLRAAAKTTTGSDNNNTPMARMTPNPYEASIGNQLVLGTDGLNVRDLQKYILKPPVVSEKDGADSNNDSSDGTKALSPQPLTELDALEQTLQWAHICPTGPNSPDLGMVPSGDPMVMASRASNIYFCGNCKEGFATKLLAHNDDGDTAMDGTAGGSPKTRLICVPKFSETGEAVLVNLKTLDVEILRFTGNSDEKSD